MTSMKKAKLLRLELDDLDLSPDLLEEIVCDRMARWARRGGHARAKALSPARRKAIAKLANAARWNPSSAQARKIAKLAKQARKGGALGKVK